MLVSDYILARLADAGVDTAFLVYGGACAELVDAFPRQSRIRYVVAIHEQGAGFMAEGYAKAKGFPGCAIATSGPGGGNLVTAIQNCYYDSAPCVVLTGQVATNLIRPTAELRQRGFQETPIVDIVRPITKYARTVMHAEEIGWTMDQALYKASADRPGPVLVDLPGNVQRAQLPQPLTQWKPTIAKTNEAAVAARAFLEDLKNAKRPAILVGGGARGARDAIPRFALDNRIPVFKTWNALDVVADYSLVYAGTVGTYGGPGRNFGIQNCDLLLALGCRFSGRITGGMPESFARGAKIYRVDVDASILKREWQERKADVNVLADASEFMLELAVGEDKWRNFLGER